MYVMCLMLDDGRKPCRRALSLVGNEEQDGSKHCCHAKVWRKTK
eukprot:CCRYP_003139-RA/>CCRYP_003139-RA protein AED:0.43 eAED:0.43 QI:90/1/1/1/0/0/2/104/43